MSLLRTGRGRGMTECPVCRWFDNPEQEYDPDFKNWENDMSLNEERAAWKRGEKVH